MSHPLDGILSRLESATRGNRAKWKASGRPLELELPIDGAIVMLSKNPFTEMFGGGLTGPYKLSVLAESGTEVSSLEARQGEPYFTRLKALYDAASQRARGITDVLADVEQTLAAL